MDSLLEKYFGDLSKNIMYNYLVSVLFDAKYADFFEQAIFTETRVHHNVDGWVNAYRDKLFFALEFPDAKALNSYQINDIARERARKRFEEILKDDPKTKANVVTLKSNEKKTIIRDQSYFFHDEPWLTLMALWGIYSTCITRKQDSITELFTNSLLSKTESKPIACPNLTNDTECRVEVTLRTNPLYGKSIEAKYNKGYKHLYADVMADAGKKQSSKNTQIYEGSTHLDGLITWYSGSKRNRIYIEAKYLSDISYQTRFIADRNQIARTIDAAIYDAIYAGKDNFDVSQIENFWFFLLTPINYRTDKYGSVPSRYQNAENTCEARSRLYCYKMDEYLSGHNLKRDLPHWDKYLNDTDWDKIASHIGWISWEEIVEALVHDKIFSESIMKNYLSFFYDRGIVPKFDDPKDQLDYLVFTDPDLEKAINDLNEAVGNSYHGTI